MTAEEYIAERVDDQLKWYGDKSRRARMTFFRLRGAEIACAAAIPVVTAYSDSLPGGKMVAAVLGAAIVALTAFVSLGQHQENWVSYRATSEALKREKFLFETAADPYTDGETFKTFVRRVESLLANENTGWSERVRLVGKSGGDKANGAVE